LTLELGYGSNDDVIEFILIDYFEVGGSDEIKVVWKHEIMGIRNELMCQNVKV
jgi:hypothetical protein